METPKEAAREILSETADRMKTSYHITEMDKRKCQNCKRLEEINKAMYEALEAMTKGSELGRESRVVS